MSNKMSEMQKMIEQLKMMIEPFQKMIEQLENMTVDQPRNNIQSDNLIIQNNRLQPIVIPNEHKYSWIKTSTDTELHLWSYNIGSNPDDLKYLADGIRNNKTITKLNL